MPSSIPPFRSAVHHVLSIRDHPAQVPFAFGMQPRMPVIGSVSDDPVVLLLQDPREIRPVVVPVYRSISDEAIDQDRGFVVLEREGRIVDVQVLRKRVVCGIEAEGAC
jgi:hypothetical protein